MKLKDFKNYLYRNYLGFSMSKMENEEKISTLKFCAENNNDPVCFYDLAIECLKGKICEKNATLAVEYLKKASELNYKHAHFKLGQIFEYGLDEIAIDYKTAFHYYMKSAKAKDSRACVKVGEFYEEGKGVEKNLLTAENWYLTGLSKGCSYAVPKIQKIEIKAKNEAKQIETLEK